MSFQFASRNFATPGSDRLSGGISGLQTPSTSNFATQSSHPRLDDLRTHFSQQQGYGGKSQLKNNIERMIQELDQRLRITEEKQRDEERRIAKDLKDIGNRIVQENEQRKKLVDSTQKEIKKMRDGIEVDIRSIASKRERMSKERDLIENRGRERAFRLKTELDKK